MQLSNYIKIYPHRERWGYLLLFSTKRASIILLHESVLKSIEDGNLSSSEEETLHRLGFLVQDVNEEKKEMLGLFNEVNKRRKKFNALVVTNLDCNLACRYCYEGRMKGKFYMSLETADLLINFAGRHFAAGKTVHVNFYGGEPLLSFELIKYISKELKIAAEERGLKYTFNLVTNGTLLTENKAEELAPLGLKGAKITIDGPMENHDRFRPFKSGTGTFDVIIKNIKDTCEILKIQVGGNYTSENYRDFPGLLDYLLDEGLTPDKISIVKFDPVAKTGGKFALPDFREGCESINEPWLFEASLFLREEILKKGFNTPKVAPSPCMIEYHDEIVVNFDGTIYKCPGLIGWEGLGVGDLRRGIKDYSKSYNLDLWKREECLNCEYLPLCFGGCRYMKLLRDGNIDDVDCKKSYLDATLETFIRQEIKYRLKIDRP
ncbi:MAG: geopeptide radical SAM maturase [Nitrospirota bacterium]